MGTRAPWAIRQELPAESDERLTDRAREGDQSAFGELYRRHRKAAESTAWCLLRSKNDADDVVADAFAGVLSALRNGRGPRDNFRRYLLACVRNGCRVRRSRCVPMQEASMDRRASVLEEPERYVEADTVARAFSALTPRWQYTLWLTEVEQRPAHEVSERMHLSPNATAALAHRARQAFATAYLAEHVGALRNRDCVAHAPQLAAYVRGALSGAAEAGLEHHLVACRDCAVAAAELRDVNASLRSIAVPGPLLAAGAAATSGAVTAATSATVGVTGTAVTATTATGAWAALSGAGVLVKALVAVVLVTPAVTGGGPDVGAATGQHSASGDSAEADPGASPQIEPTPSRDVAIAIEVDWSGPQAAAPPPVVAAAPLPAVEPVDDVVHNVVDNVPVVDVADDVVHDEGEDVVDEIVEPVRQDIAAPGIDDIIEPAVDDIIDRTVDGVVEPIVHGLDEALATMGLGSRGQTVHVTQSLVPLLDGPLLDAVVDDLLHIDPPGESAPTGLTDLFTGLQETDGSEPVAPSPAAVPAPGPGASSIPAPAPPPASVSTMPSVTLPPVAIPPVSVPDLTSGVIPEVAVDIPSVEILDHTIDPPAIELPAIELADLGIPPLTLPAGPQ